MRRTSASLPRASRASGEWMWPATSEPRRARRKDGGMPTTRACGATVGEPPQDVACHERAAQRRVEWCERGDSNPHVLANASPSSWCVCQFRHFRDEAGRLKPASTYDQTGRQSRPLLWLLLLLRRRGAADSLDQRTRAALTEDPEHDRADHEQRPKDRAGTSEDGCAGARAERRLAPAAAERACHVPALCPAAATPRAGAGSTRGRTRSRSGSKA